MAGTAVRSSRTSPIQATSQAASPQPIPADCVGAGGQEPGGVEGPAPGIPALEVGEVRAAERSDRRQQGVLGQMGKGEQVEGGAGAQPGRVERRAAGQTDQPCVALRVAQCGVQVVRDSAAAFVLVRGQ